MVETFISGSGVDAGYESRPWLRNYPANVEWNKAYVPTPVSAILDGAAQKHPHMPCTYFLGRTRTYAEVSRLVNLAAAGLQKLGVKKGDRVGLLLPNSPTFVVFYYAALKIGAIVVNYNPLYTPEELAFQVKDSGTRLMVTLDLKMLFEKVEGLIRDGHLDRAVVASFADLLPFPQSLLFRFLRGKDVADPAKSPHASDILRERDVLDNDGHVMPVAIDPQTDIAVLQYTGGTTGTPKGAMLTHANVSINTQQVIDWAPDLKDAEERVLCVLPFFHVFAMTAVMNFGVAKAAELLIMPRFVLGDAVKLILQKKPTIMPGVPTLFNAIAGHDRLAGGGLSFLKFCLSGGAPLPVEIKARFEKLTGCTLVEGYGLTEASPVVTCNPLDGRQKSGSIGLPLPATEISLRDLDDPTREVALGERGELCVRGPQVMRGYWNKPDETAGQFLGDFLRTGDVATMDADGFYAIVDRIKDLIICSGFNVYPRRIEDAIYTHPAVAEVNVIGVPDAYRGEAPKAFIRLKPGQTCTKAEMMRHLSEKLAKIELPAAIEFRDELPKTMIGKLSKKDLKKEEMARTPNAM